MARIDARSLSLSIVSAWLLAGLSILAQAQVHVYGSGKVGRQYITPTLTFGSCYRQHQSPVVWDTISSQNPDAHILMGDNVYTDIGLYKLLPTAWRYSMAYNRLSREPGFQRLSDQAVMLATWDDHDYGKNDAGSDYAHKDIAKKNLLDFFSLPSSSVVHQREGVYQSHLMTAEDLSIQIILLDTRSFRGAIDSPLYGHDCALVDGGVSESLLVSSNSSASFLGEAQWVWLAEQFEEPADVRLLVSSVQLLPVDHCYEKWANFPAERLRLLDLIQQSNANGVIVLSGDRHHGDISRAPSDWVGYPLYEVTASGLNSARPSGVGKNRFRVIRHAVAENHFGAVRFSRVHGETSIHLQLLSAESGDLLREQIVPLRELR